MTAVTSVEEISTPRRTRCGGKRSATTPPISANITTPTAPVAETTESSTGEPPWAMTWKTMVSAHVPCASTTASMAAASRG